MTGLLLFSLAAFGFTTPMLAFAAASIFVAFIGPRQPRFIMSIFNAPVNPLPLPLFVAFIINAIVNMVGYALLFGPVMRGALVLPAALGAAVVPGWLLAIIPALMVASGGLIEGLLAESTFDQRWHLFAFLVLDAGLATHALLYLRLIAALA